MSNHITATLASLLADTFALALKTHNYHWNVTGPGFYGLHKLFEEQYESLYEAADKLAERLRALGEYAPGSFAEFSKLTSIADAKKGAASSDILTDLAASHEKIAGLAKKLIQLCHESQDEVTADIVLDRVDSHEKITWMLRSSTAAG